MKKLKSELNTLSSYKVDKIPEKNNSLELIEKYIHTKEDVDLVDLYELRGNDGSSSSGFYITDGSIFDEVVKDHCKQDDKERDKILDELKTKYPLLVQNQKTKKLILDPVEKMFIWDVRIHRQLIKSLSEKSIFCDTSKMIEMVSLFKGFKEWLESQLEKGGEVPLHPLEKLSIYSNNKDNQNASEILICNIKVEETDELSTLIHRTNAGLGKTEGEYIGDVKVSNNRLNFYMQSDFSSAKIPFRNEHTNGVIDTFEERSVQCENGHYSIETYSDKTFNENFLKYKSWLKLSEVLDNESIKANDRLEELEGQYDYAETEYLAVTDKIAEEQMKLNEKYRIKEAGMYLIVIKKI